MRIHLAAAAAILLLLFTHRHADAICRGTTQPVFSDVVLAAPDGGVVKGQIAYAQGTRLDATFTLPACTTVTDVFADGRAVVFTRWGVDTILADGRRRQTMRIFTTNDGSGRALSVRIVARATSDYVVRTTPPTGDVVVTRVGVYRANGRVSFSVSEAEVRTRLLMALYRQFGLDGRSRQGSATIYGPSYDLEDEPTVTMYPGATHPSYPPQLAIEAGKIHFAYHVMASIDHWCDASVTIRGTLRLETSSVPEGPQGRFVHAVWEGEGAIVDATSEIYCAAPQALSGVNLWIVPFITSNVEERVEHIVQEAIDSAAGTCPIDPTTGQHTCHNIDPRAVNPTITLEKDRIVVSLSTPESVTIQVPYRAGGVDDPAATGLALNPGEQVIVMGQGRTSVCENDWSGQPIGACAAVPSGPQGRYNALGNSPLTFPGLGTGSLTGYEDDVFGGLAHFDRDPAALPLPFEHAGSLLTRVATGGVLSRPMPVGLPCTVAAGAGAPARMAFGVNDHRTAAGAELGTGGFEVHVVWTNGFGRAPSCAYEVVGGIRAKFDRLGGAGGTLGLPLTDELDTLSGSGRVTHFERGSVLWRRGAPESFSVIHGIRARYADMGWDLGPIGHPTSDEECSAEGQCRARLNRFDRGTIVWTLARGTRAVLGVIDDKWRALGATTSTLGLPVTEEQPVLRWGGYELGRSQDFERGAIAWSASTGAHEVRNGIFDKWVAMGRELGELGFPLTDEDCRKAPGCFNDFTGGSIYYHPSYGMHEVRGAIHTYWLGLGGVSSSLGWPISDRTWWNGYPAYRFERGTIVDRGWAGGPTVI